MCDLGLDREREREKKVKGEMSDEEGGGSGNGITRREGEGRGREEERGEEKEREKERERTYRTLRSFLVVHASPLVVSNKEEQVEVESHMIYLPTPHLQPHCHLSLSLCLYRSRYHSLSLRPFPQRWKSWKGEREEM